jgi:hypothetical protein
MGTVERSSNTPGRDLVQKLTSGLVFKEYIKSYF